ncbi:hypothetical protein EDD21DRAFT_376145 [Dissophora ornata]|nr:hypothetical protein EDD21DRAFT_376145 [Dissophora ornata]
MVQYHFIFLNPLSLSLSLSLFGVAQKAISEFVSIPQTHHAARYGHLSIHLKVPLFQLPSPAASARTMQHCSYRYFEMDQHRFRTPH